MATLDEAFPSRFLKAADLSGKPRIVKIVAANEEDLKDLQGQQQKKTVVYFCGMKKSLPLNKTNFEALTRITGEDDSNDFPGHTVLMLPTKTEMAGKTVDCIRFEEVPAKKTAKKAAPLTQAVEEEDEEGDLDDGDSLEDTFR
jgi:hypothetical protein